MTQEPIDDELPDDVPTGNPDDGPMEPEVVANHDRADDEEDEE